MISKGKTRRNYVSGDHNQVQQSCGALLHRLEDFNKQGKLVKVQDSLLCFSLVIILTTNNIFIVKIDNEKITLRFKQ